MNRTKTLFSLLLLLAFFTCAAFAQSGSLSTAIEPALKSPAQFGVSITGARNVTRDTSVTALYGFSDSVARSRAVLLGVSRNIVDFLPGLMLVGDLRAGMVYSQHRGFAALVYGVGVAADLRNGYSVTYGIHVNKVRDAKLYPSLYVSVAKTF
jgi:hypothetical protein